MIIKFVRWHVDTLWTWFQLAWYLPGDDISNDNKRVMSHVRAVRARYGSHQLEVSNIFYPCPECSPTDDCTCFADEVHANGVLNHFSYRWNSIDFKETAHQDLKVPIREDNVLLYVHGGGFVAANSTVLTGAITPYVRAGMIVYAIDYPLGPESRFPDPVISVLQALEWLRTERGVQRVKLMGDSAGSSLAAMAAALACNPDLMQSFAKEVERYCDRPLSSRSRIPGGIDQCRALPHIECLVLCYGILDTKSWQYHLDSLSFVESFIASVGLQFVLSCHEPLGEFWEGRRTLADVAEHLKSFPPTLMVCGDKDPLLLSNIVAHDLLTKYGFKSALTQYSARHAFVGLPTSWLSKRLAVEAFNANQEITDFLVEECSR